MTSFDRADIVKFWHSRAANKDTRATRFHNEHLRYDLPALAAICPAGAEVLELGCGQCTLLKALVASRDVHAHGVDIVPDFLEQAISDPRLTTEVGDAVNYLPRKQYDVIVMAGLINSIPVVEERIDLYRRAEAGLKPHGTLFLKSQFGRLANVDVDAWSEALGAHYKSHYPAVDAEKGRLQELFDVMEIEAYPPSLSPHANTRFAHFLCRRKQA